jgi:aspartate--ammonia ligase
MVSQGHFFQTNLSFELNLMRVTAPLFVRAGTGINDDLNGVERPVSFNIKERQPRLRNGPVPREVERMMLADYASAGPTNMRRHERQTTRNILDSTHSIYVDQWDWERVISEDERHLDFLKCVVRKIYDVIRRTEKYICYRRNVLDPILPEEITFVHTEELEERFPDCTPKERENAICREHGAVFLIASAAG